MADLKITELGAAGALTGTELIETVQGGVNVQTTTQDIADLGVGGITRTVTGDDAITQGDNNALIIFNSASPINFTLDQLTTDSKASFINIGSAVVNFVAGAGVTITGDTSLSAAADPSFPTSIVFYQTLTTPLLVTGSGAAGASDWGDIGGTLSDQTDLQTALDSKAPLANPTFTGTPAAPTAAPGTSTTQVATTAFVAAAVTGGSVADGDKGDITVSSSGAVWTIDNNAVTEAKLATAVNPLGVQRLYISASAMVSRVTNGASVVSFHEMATSLFTVMSRDFDQNTQEFAQAQFVLPDKWNNGTITARVYWTALSGSGTVQWGMSAGAYSNDDALTVAFGTPQTVDDTLIAANDLHITDFTSAITIAGTPAAGDLIGFQISRNVASDTLATDACLIGVQISITVNAAHDA